MEPLSTNLTHLKDHVTEYVKTYADLTKVKATKGAANAAAGASVALFGFMFLSFFMVFLFVGLAFWIGAMLESYAAGFFIVAGFFLFLLALIFILRKKVIVPFIRNSIISKVYE